MKISLGTSALAFVVTIGFASIASAGPLLGDSDGDGTDDLFDTCLNVSNASQFDADLDGCGNACDADYDQNGAVGGADFTIFRSLFGSTSGGVADHDDNGAVGGADFTTFRALFGGTPGPSLRPTRDPTACP